MKRILTKSGIVMGKILAAMAMMVTVANVNSACLFITHQPEMPEISKKLRKF